MTALTSIERDDVRARFMRENTDATAATKADISTIIAEMDDAIDTFVNVTLPETLSGVSVVGHFSAGQLDMLSRIIAEKRFEKVA